MTTRGEHRDEALRLLHEADIAFAENLAEAEHALAAAQVHALLALSADEAEAVAPRTVYSGDEAA